MALSKLLSRWALAYRRAQRLPKGRSGRVAAPVVKRYSRAVYAAAVREGVL